MAAFFQWVSENPLAANLLLFAFALVIIAFVLAVTIATIAIIRKETISIAGLHFGPIPGSRWMLQAGDENIPANHPNKPEFYNGTYEGQRTILVPVRFDQPFKKTPLVVVSLSKIDAGDFENLRINRLMVRAQKVRLNGFDLCFETWADSKVYDAAATWIAFGE